MLDSAAITYDAILDHNKFAPLSEQLLRRFRKLTDKKASYLVGVSPLALAACGGGSSEDGPTNEPYTVTDLPQFDTMALAEGIETDSLPTDAYAVTGTFDEIFAFNLDREELAENPPSRIDVSGEFTFDTGARGQDYVTFTENVHMVGANFTLHDPSGVFEYIDAIVSSDDGSAGHLVLRGESTLSISGADAALQIGDGNADGAQNGTLDVFEGSSITVTQDRVNEGNDYPLARILVGHEATGDMTLNGADTTVNVTGHRANIDVGWQGSGELTVENGANLTVISSDNGAESRPEARLLIGRGEQDDVTPSDGTMLITSQAEVSLSGHNAIVAIGLEHQANGELTVNDGASLKLSNTLTRNGANDWGSSTIEVGKSYDEATPAGNGILNVAGTGTEVILDGQKYTALRIGDDGSTGKASITDGAMIKMSNAFGTIGDDDWSGAQIRVGRGEGASGDLLVDGAGTSINYTAIATELIIADNRDFQGAVDGNVVISGGAEIVRESVFDDESTNSLGAYTWTLLGRNNGGDDGDSTANLTVTGAGSKMIASGATNWVNVATTDDAHGTFSILNGARAEFNYVSQNTTHQWAGETILALGAGDTVNASANLLVSGANSQLMASGEYTAMMVARTAEVTVNNGGAITITSAADAGSVEADANEIIFSGDETYLSNSSGVVTAGQISIVNGATLVGSGTFTSTNGIDVVNSDLNVGDNFKNEDGPNIEQFEGTMDMSGDVTLTNSTIVFSAGEDEAVDLIDVTGALTITGSTIFMNALNNGEYLVAKATDGITVDDTSSITGASISIIDLVDGGQGLQLTVSDII